MKSVNTGRKAKRIRQTSPREQKRHKVSGMEYKLDSIFHSHIRKDMKPRCRPAKESTNDKKNKAISPFGISLESQKQRQKAKKKRAKNKGESNYSEQGNAVQSKRKKRKKKGVTRSDWRRKRAGRITLRG